MEYQFLDSLPGHVQLPVQCITDAAPANGSLADYLLIDSAGLQAVFQINYSNRCSPFRQALVEGHLLLVGHEAHFYLYDLQKRQLVVQVPMDGYFGSFHRHGERVYVASAGSLTCISMTGEICWCNSSLGVDGVTVHGITEQAIHGAGEWDPPGGWRSFVLDLDTGENAQ